MTKCGRDDAELGDDDEDDDDELYIEEVEVDTKAGPLMVSGNEQEHEK
jgi:hypothetical protein